MSGADGKGMRGEGLRGRGARAKNHGEEAGVAPGRLTALGLSLATATVMGRNYWRPGGMLTTTVISWPMAETGVRWKTQCPAHDVRLPNPPNSLTRFVLSTWPGSWWDKRRSTARRCRCLAPSRAADEHRLEGVVLVQVHRPLTIRVAFGLFEVVSGFQRAVGAIVIELVPKALRPVPSKSAHDHIPGAGVGVAGAGDVQIVHVAGLETALIAVVFDAPMSRDPGGNHVAAIGRGVVVNGVLASIIYFAGNDDRAIVA